MLVNTKSPAFQHILNVLNFGQEFKEYLKEQSCINIGQLASIHEADIADQKYRVEDYLN